MDDSRFEERIAPLVAAAPAAHRPWLRRLLANRDSMGTHEAIENELFVTGDLASAPLLFASASRGDGRTTLALLHGALTAILDPRRRVLLIDADLEHGTLAQLLGIAADAPGLAEYFAGEAEARDCVRPTGLANLLVVPHSRAGGGRAAFDPAGFRGFLEAVRPAHDRILVDSSAGAKAKSVLAVASVVVHTILVIRYGGPTREQVAALAADLERAGGRVAGAVLNRREYVVPQLLYAMA